MNNEKTYVSLSSLDPVKIKEGPKALPKSYKGISGFDKLSDKELLEHGFYRFRAGAEPEHDPNTNEVEWHSELKEDTVWSIGIVVPLRPSLVKNPMQEAQKRLLAELAEYRWQVETGGIEFEGHMFSTQRDGDLTLYLAAQDGEPQRWKNMAGGWVDLDAESIMELFNAVKVHRKECYKREAVISAEIQKIESPYNAKWFSVKEAWDATS